jgi:hypothetical protein
VLFSAAHHDLPSPLKQSPIVPFVIALMLSVVATASAQSDVVLYPSDVSVIRGNWSRVSSTTGAGGQKLTSADQGWSSPDSPLAAPADYFEASFPAQAGVTYRLWLRLRAAGNSKWNESVWVQFSSAVTPAGAPLWRIGTASALAVNLENCSGCGVSGWGWQDNAWWLGTSSVVRFPTSGTQTVRVQTREDGVDVDQIVLSAGPYLNAPPGALRDDATIVPKGGVSPAIALLRQPYLQQVTDSSAVIAWTTREPGPAEVRYVSSSGAAGTVGASTRQFASSTTGLAYDFYQHEASLVGLAASTRYTYDIRVQDVDVNAPVDAFTTAPPDNTGTIRFIAFGDSGTGSTAQRDLAARMAGQAFDLALHAGDVAYGNSGGTGGGSYRQYDDWAFGIYASIFRSRPFFPTNGNHDVEIAGGRPYRDVFVLPGNGASSAYPDHAERYYSFDYGLVHFVALDTEVAFQDAARRQAQLEWLESDLAATSQPWRIAYFHRSPYSSGGEHGSDLVVRNAFGPIFERHGVQLAISAHEHVYERSRPWREFTADGGHVTYVVTGGGGAPLYPAASGPWTATSASVHHFVRASVTDCTLAMEAVRIDGSVFDSFTVDRCGTGPPPPFTRLIQAEDFDAGPNGVAYFDEDAGNNGGQYRQTDVDIERCAEGGYNVGWIGAGEWLNYAIDAPAAGTYTVELRVASPGGSRMHLESNGTDKTGPISIPATGGWQRWATVTRSVTFAAGPQTLRLVFDNAGLNVNFVRITASAGGGSTPYGGVPRAVPGTVQAEDFDEGGPGVGYNDRTAGNNGGQYRATDVDIERTADSIGIYNVGWASATEWLNYTIDVAEAGTYVLTARVASPTTGGTFHVEFDGVDATGPLQVPSTGGWQVWRDVTATVTLQAGVQVMRVVLDTNGSTSAVGNFNYVRLGRQ